MNRKTLAALLATALLAAGCELEQHENAVADCTSSDLRYEITVSVYRDSDQTDGDEVPGAFTEACRLVSKAFADGQVP